MLFLSPFFLPLPSPSPPPLLPSKKQTKNKIMVDKIAEKIARERYNKVRNSLLLSNGSGETGRGESTREREREKRGRRRRSKAASNSSPAFLRPEQSEAFSGRASKSTCFSHAEGSAKRAKERTRGRDEKKELESETVFLFSARFFLPPLLAFGVPLRKIFVLTHVPFFSLLFLYSYTHTRKKT